LAACILDLAMPSERPPILIVDDEEEVCISLKEILETKGFNACYETDPREVIRTLEKNTISLVLLDIRMPSIGGIDLLQRVKARFCKLPIIMFSGHATVDDAIRAMRFGATNLYTKPLDINGLVQEIEKIQSVKQDIPCYTDKARILTRNPEMERILTLVEKAAPTEATVLITGESGTGKELIANILHQQSTRSSEQLVKINCAAIPETLLESEMFGHEKGAFTDAKEQKQGYFEVATGGSIFLDEIGDMSLHTQAKMLRVLQEKQFTRLGGSKTLHTDCRIIAATNKDIDELIHNNSFREDLYYRLSVIHLHLPPLRERKEDIPFIARHFLEEFSARYGKAITGFTPEVEHFLTRHDWPGNIRELKNIIERGVIFSSGTKLDFDTLPDHYKHHTSPLESEELPSMYQNSARDVIKEALKRSGGVKSEAAKLLNINRKTLYNRMKKLKIDQ
jgi:DNA-binding NtrC family response regulator